jgi:hypothetical protein
MLPLIQTMVFLYLEGHAWEFLLSTCRCSQPTIYIRASLQETHRVISAEAVAIALAALVLHRMDYHQVSFFLILLNWCISSTLVITQTSLIGG